MTTRLMSLLASLLICGCAGNTGTPSGSATSCVAGATQSCTCMDGQPGAQTCGADGLSWGACQCNGSGSNTPYPDAGVTPPPQSDSGTGTGTGTGAGQTGTMTCDQMDSCMMSCSENDTTCVDNCYYQGTAAAQAQMSALESCMDTAEQGACQTQCTSYTQQCSDCLDQACASQLTACLGAGSGTGTGTGTGTGQTGTMTCSQMDACMMSCSDTDNACFDNCYYQGTANAQSLMAALESCLDSAEQGSCASQCASYNQQCWTCIDQACQSQLNACLSN